MTTFRYASTDLITGQLLCDDIPLDVQSFSQQLNGGGTLSASLDLSQDYAANTPYLEALTPRRTVLWVLADAGSGFYPVWCGPVLDEPDMSRSGGALPVSASTMDAIWGKRLITATLEYQAIDMFAVFLDLLRYGTTKTSPYITTTSPFQGPASPLVGQACAVAGLVLPQGAAAVAGVPWSASYLYSDNGQVSSAWSDMVSAGLEYAFVPLSSGGNLACGVYLAYNSGLGRSYPQSGYSVTYGPGGVASDYGWQVTGSQGSNYLWATAPPNGSAEQWESQYPHGADLSDLEAGYPLFEDTVSWDGSTVTAQSQIDAFADGQVGIVTQGMTTPVITIPDGQRPSILDLVLGDQFPFAATSPIHPPGTDGQPGIQAMLRLTGWTMTPPGPQQSASLQLTTSQILATP